MANAGQMHLMGCAELSALDANGNAINFLSYGETAELQITIEEELVQARNSCGAIAGIAGIATKYTGLSGTLTLRSNDPKALRLRLFGDEILLPAGTFAAESFADGIVAGQRRKLPNNRSLVSAVTISDATNAVIPPANYDIDLKTGLVTFKVISGTQPYKVAGTQLAVQGSSILTKKSSEQALVFKGIDILNDDKRVNVNFNRMRLTAAGSFTVKGSGNDPDSLEIPFTCLLDASGQYGTIVQES